MKILKISNCSGLTLVEVLISTFIFMIITGALYTGFLTGNATWVRYENSLTTQQHARQALAKMAIELRQASNIGITQDTDDSTINFTHEGIGSVTYSWSTGGSDPYKIIRSFSSTQTVLADHITSLSFTDHTDAVTVDLTSQKQTAIGQVSSFNIKEKIALR